MPVPPAVAAPGSDRPWHALPVEAATSALGVDPADGLTSSEAAARLDRYGRNELPAARRPSVARAVVAGLVEPLTLLLAALLVAALLIREISAALLLAAALVIDVVVGANERLKARVPVAAVGHLPAATAMVRRGGRVIPVNATELVPGDIVSLSARDVVPADGRLLDATGLTVDEQVVTGLHGPVSKGAAPMDDAAAAIADRSTMVYTGSAVIRGVGTFVVTATAGATELGTIARSLVDAERGRAPLGRRLRGLSTAIAIVALGVTAAVVAAGWLRDGSPERVVLLGVAAGVAAVPAGFTTFVRASLAVGVQRLAAIGIAARYLQAVGALGSVTAIDASATGFATLGIPTARSVLYRGGWYTVEGDGAETTGRMLHVAGASLPGFDRLAFIAALASDPGGAEPGGARPIEEALVVLAAKLGVDAEQSRRTYPRIGGLRRDATSGLTASVHGLPLDGAGSAVVTVLVIGSPDAVLARSTAAEWAIEPPVPIGSVLAELEAARDRMRADGLRVVGLATRRLDEAPEPSSDPESVVAGLTFVGLVGIADPVRIEGRSAIADLARAGIETRVVSGDDVDATAVVVESLDLGGATASGPQTAEFSDDELLTRLAGLRGTARMAASDRLRLVGALRARGAVVGVLGTGVVDGPALRSADVGIATGPAVPVAVEAASIVIADDDPRSVVRAIGIGRESLDRVGAVARLAMTQLAGFVALFVAASLLAVNDGLALAPVQVLFVSLVVTVFPVVAIAADVPDGDAMDRPPPDPSAPLGERPALVRRVVAGLTLGLATFAVYPLCAAVGWGAPAFDGASVPTTMAFVTIGLGTILAGLAARRPVDWAFRSPLPRFLGILAIPLVLLFLSTELRVLQEFLVTVDLRQEQWGAAIALGSVVFWVMEADKLLQRRVRIRFH